MKKALSIIEIKILLILGIIALFIISYIIEFIQKNMWIVYLGITITIVLIVFAYFQAQEEKDHRENLSLNSSKKTKNICHRCGSSNITVKEKKSFLGWTYTNKDGSPDKRRKYNPPLYHTEYEYKCLDCIENLKKITDGFLCPSCNYNHINDNKIAATRREIDGVYVTINRRKCDNCHAIYEEEITK